MKILRYKISDLSREFTIEMPSTAQVLDIKLVYNAVYLYALGDFEQEKVKRHFLPVVVGQIISENQNLKYINILEEENWLQPCLIFEIT